MGTTRKLDKDVESNQTRVSKRTFGQKLRRFFRWMFFLGAFGAFAYVGVQAADVYFAMKSAIGCLALTSNTEGNVLDEEGEGFITWVILNRANTMPGEDSFFTKVCKVAGGDHWNKATKRSHSDFSALDKLLRSTSRYGWDRSLGIAQDRLFLAKLGFEEPKLPRIYTYFYSTLNDAPVPETFLKANKIVCDKKHKSGKYTMYFCRPNVVEQI